jgi:CRP-like cAMP-binding protein
MKDRLPQLPNFDEVPVKTVKTNKWLYGYGDPAEAVLILRTGKVKSFVPNIYPSSSSDFFTLSIVSGIAILGQEALERDKITYASSAKTLTNCDVQRIPIDYLHTKMSADPDLTLTLYQHLAATYRSRLAKLTRMIRDESSQRLAAEILILSQDTGLQIKGFSQQELAELIGMTRQSTNKAIQDLKAQGALRTTGECKLTLIQNSDKLEEIARSGMLIHD